MLVLQEEAGIPLTAEQHDFLSYASDEEHEKRELTANYLFMTKLQPTSSNMDIALCMSLMKSLRGNVEQHDVNNEETNVYFESFLHNFKVELDKCVIVHQTLKLAHESRSKIKQLAREVKPIDYSKLNGISEVFTPQMAKSKEQSLFSDKTTVSKTFSKPVLVAKPQKVFDLDEESLSNTPNKSLGRGFSTTNKKQLVTLKLTLESETTLAAIN
nr:hypothetical protein [Tanacetum cinerariifolium]